MERADESTQKELLKLLSQLQNGISVLQVQPSGGE